MFAQDAVTTTPLASPQPWVIPVIAGGFTLLGVAITLIINYQLQKNRDEKESRRKEYEQLRDWTREVLSKIGEIANWAARQQSETQRTPAEDYTRESIMNIERVKSTFKDMDLFVPDQVRKSADDLLLQVLLLASPIWNAQGYANQMTDTLRAERDFINDVRRFGGFPASNRSAGTVLTRGETLSKLPGQVFEMVEANLVFRGYSKEAAQKAVDNMIIKWRQEKG